MSTGAIIGIMLAATAYSLVLVRWPSLAAHVPAMLLGFLIVVGSGGAVGAWLAAS